MEPPFQDLLAEFDRLAPPASVLRDWVHQGVAIADTDPEMALTRARKVLEFVVRQVYENRVKEPPGTRPLENLLQRLVKDQHLPTRVAAYANAVRDLGNVGTHNFTETITPADVRQSLTQLLPVVEWYVTQDFAREPERTSSSTRRPAAQTIRSRTARAECLRVVPKGLRSFDRADCDFFLELLPGPRDASNLPPSIRFWKDRLETTADLTFTVGLIYGPSGCGKSSLVKAGLIPRLPEHVRTIYIEATPEETEGRLLKGLRQRCPTLPADVSLHETLVALRTGAALGRGEKVVIILDQFEQWLHARRGEETPELVQALRQCDGLRVQALVMVRDDFWLAVSRFLAQLEVRLIEGENTALVDLFDLLHARKVLALFGRAFGRLPDEPGKITADQEAFLDQAVSGLAEEGKVISVRLALFAEMVKGKPWTPDTLREVGGMEGIGVTFLEETFSGAAAPAEHRLHQKAARAVLDALLPEKGSDIKGHMRARHELQELSGYASRARDFHDLLRILDTELRLVTPTDPEGLQGPDRETMIPGGAAITREKYYQLTHDYLVPALREWLTRKQGETRRGRAKLKLAQLEVVWRGRPETQYLPKWRQWANILLYTRRREWTDPQRRMMRRAAGHHIQWTCFYLVLFTLACWGVFESVGWLRARGLVQALETAEAADVPNIIDELAPWHRWADPRLRELEATSEGGSREKRRARLALVKADPSFIDPLYNDLLDATTPPPEVLLIRQILTPYKEQLIGPLWQEVEKTTTARRHLAAACALAAYAPTSPDWQKPSLGVADQFVAVEPVHLGTWMKGFVNVRAVLVAPLAAIYRNAERRESERLLAANILAEYELPDHPDRLADLLLDGEDKQFTVLFDRLVQHAELLAAVCDRTIATPLDETSTQSDKEHLARRQANAAVVLVRLGRPASAWRLLQFGPDPRARSFLIHRLGPLGANPLTVAARLGVEQDISARRALFLALGEMPPLPAAERDGVITEATRAYQDDWDAGLRGAAEWLLHQWKQEDRLRAADAHWRNDANRRQERLEAIRKRLASGKPDNCLWYVTGQGQTMVVVPGPVEITMGSPAKEIGREKGIEDQVRKWISRPFAIGAREVTRGQYQMFRPKHKFHESAVTDECPANRLNWFDAAAYCNWLSAQEGILENEWCYLPNKGEYAEGMKLAADYLKREGYRLASEAEWECACRSGTVTSRSYGDADDLLEKYGWYTRNSRDRWLLPGPEGIWLKPNEWGLFEMLGNTQEWAQERFQEKYQPGEDVEDKELECKDKDPRALRGGSYGYQAMYVRSAYRLPHQASHQYNSFGFRVCRTLRPGSTGP